MFMGSEATDLHMSETIEDVELQHGTIVGQLHHYLTIDCHAQSYAQFIVDSYWLKQRALIRCGQTCVV